MAADLTGENERRRRTFDIDFFAIEKGLFAHSLLRGFQTALFLIAAGEGGR